MVLRCLQSKKQRLSVESRLQNLRVWLPAAPHRRCLTVLTELTVLTVLTGLTGLRALQAHQTGWALAQAPKASPAWS